MLRLKAFQVDLHSILDSQLTLHEDRALKSDTLQSVTKSQLTYGTALETVITPAEHSMTPLAVVGVGFVGRAHLDALRHLGIPVQGILGSTP